MNTANALFFNNLKTHRVFSQCLYLYILTKLITNSVWLRNGPNTEMTEGSIQLLASLKHTQTN